MDKSEGDGQADPQEEDNDAPHLVHKEVAWEKNQGKILEIISKRKDSYRFLTRHEHGQCEQERVPPLELLHLLLLLLGVEGQAEGDGDAKDAEEHLPRVGKGYLRAKSNQVWEIL